MVDIDTIFVEHSPVTSPALVERVALALNSTLELREVLRVLAEVTLEETMATRVSLFLWEGDRLEPAVALGLEPDEDLWAAFQELGPIILGPEQLDAATSSRAVVLPDAATSPVVPKGWAERFDLHTIVLVPLLAAGEPCGLMAVDYPDPVSTERDLGLLEAVAGYAGAAVNNARLYAEAKRRAALGEVLARAAAALAAALPPRAVATRLEAAFTELASPRWCAVGLIDGTVIRPLLITARPPHEALTPETISVDDIPVDIHESFCAAWESGVVEPTLVEGDPWLDGLVGLHASPARHLVVPLAAGQEPVGLLVGALDAKTAVDPPLTAAVTTLAALGGAALERHGLLARREREVRQRDVLYRVSTALTERADAKILLKTLNELLSPEGIEVQGMAFRDASLARHLQGARLTPEEREVLRESDAPMELDDDLLAVPMRVGRRKVGLLRVRRHSDDPEVDSFLDLLAAGVGELAMRGHLRGALEEAALERAVAAERERIAGDLHDTVGRVFATLALMGRRFVEEIPTDGQARARAARLVELAESGKWHLDLALQARTFVPGPKRGLVSALRGLAKQIEDDSGIAVVVDTEGRAGKIGGAVEHALYRLTFEALVNAWRHARCSVIRVQAVFNPDDIILRVTDDGVGISTRAGQPVPGLGLMGMRRLIRDVGGEVRYMTNEPHGATIEAVVPRRTR